MYGTVRLDDLEESDMKSHLKSGKVRVDEDGWLRIETPWDSYDVEPERINTFAKCFEWCRHMTEKTWVTPEIIYDMVIVLSHNLANRWNRMPPAT